MGPRQSRLRRPSKLVSEPAPEIGRISPDGMWRWDGRQWVPATPRPPGQGQGGPRGRRTWIWWVAGGCALLLILGVGGAVIGGAALVNRLQHGDFACLPSDFPSYPGAAVTGEKTYFGTGVAPGDSRECTESLDSDDDVATVTDFYTSRLSSGDWKITSSDRANGTISFARISRPQTVGAVTLLGRGTHTVINIKLDS